MQGDIQRVLIDEGVISRRVSRMAEEVQADFPEGPLLVIVLLKGAMVFASDLLRRIARPLEIECLNVASYHGATESCGRVDFLDRTFPRVAGRSVLLLDDILDTGRTLHAVAARLRDEGAKEVRTGVLLAKDKAREADVRATYVGFEVGDEFVVGYGLDFRGRYRNLPFVGVLKPEVVERAGPP